MHYRLKLSLMFWMIKCVMNAMEQDVEANLLHFSVQMSPVFSTTVSIAGPRFIPDPEGNSINLLSKKELIGQGLSPSVGAEHHHGFKCCYVEHFV